jgi:hypothetical protein
MLQSRIFYLRHFMVNFCMSSSTDSTTTCVSGDLLSFEVRQGNLSVNMSTRHCVMRRERCVSRRDLRDKKSPGAGGMWPEMDIVRSCLSRMHISKNRSDRVTDLDTRWQARFKLSFVVADPLRSE